MMHWLTLLSQMEYLFDITKSLRYLYKKRIFPVSQCIPLPLSFSTPATPITVVGMFFFLFSCVVTDSEIQSQGHPLQQPCHELKMISSSTSRTCCFDPKEALSNLAVRLVILDTFSFALKETY